MREGRSPIKITALTICFVLFFCVFLNGCGNGGTSDTQVNSVSSAGRSEPAVLVPESPGTSVIGNEMATIDISNVSEGYVHVQYLGNISKVKLQISHDGGDPYTYNLEQGVKDVFPLNQGDGTYKLTVYEHKEGGGDDEYSQAFSGQVEVTLRDEFLPFLYPNQYIEFTPESAAVKMGAELAATANDDLEAVANIYNYVIQNITYDYDKAKQIEDGTISSGYLPNVDETLQEKTGICFDYAALMTAMLRTQGIPTRLVIGYAGELYHAWISVYIKDVGWIDNIIYFDGKEWSRMDPTLAAAGDSAKEFVGDGSNYHDLYIY